MVELLFNLTWLVLSASLTALWLNGRKKRHKASRGVSVGIQLVALAMLIVVLLPAVSLTDDLQACTTPAEVDHISRRVCLLSGSDHDAPSTNFSLSGLFLLRMAPVMESTDYVIPVPAGTSPDTGHLLLTGMRPPPAIA